MPKGFSITVKQRGQAAVGNRLRDLVERHLDPHIKRAGLAVQGGVQESTPVRTGTLRRSMTTGQPVWHGRVRRVQVGTNLVYGPIVNRRGRSRGYFKRGVDKRAHIARRMLEQGAHALGREVWVR